MIRLLDWACYLSNYQKGHTLLLPKKELLRASQLQQFEGKLPIALTEEVLQFRSCDVIMIPDWEDEFIAESGLLRAKRVVIMMHTSAYYELCSRAQVNGQFGPDAFVCHSDTHVYHLLKTYEAEKTWTLPLYTRANNDSLPCSPLEQKQKYLLLDETGPWAKEALVHFMERFQLPDAAKKTIGEWHWLTPREVLPDFFDDIMLVLLPSVYAPSDEACQVLSSGGVLVTFYPHEVLAGITVDSQKQNVFLSPANEWMNFSKMILQLMIRLAEEPASFQDVADRSQEWMGHLLKDRNERDWNLFFGQIME